MMALDLVLPTVVAWLPLDAANDGSLEFPAALGYDEVVISIANVYAFSGATYSYTVNDGSAALPFEDGFESGDTSAWSATGP